MLMSTSNIDKSSYYTYQIKAKVSYFTIPKRKPYNIWSNFCIWLSNFKNIAHRNITKYTTFQIRTTLSRKLQIKHNFNVIILQLSAHFLLVQLVLQKLLEIIDSQ